MCRFIDQEIFSDVLCAASARGSILCLWIVQHLLPVYRFIFLLLSLNISNRFLINFGVSKGTGIFQWTHSSEFPFYNKYYPLKFYQLPVFQLQQPNIPSSSLSVWIVGYVWTGETEPGGDQHRGPGRGRELQPAVCVCCWLLLLSKPKVCRILSFSLTALWIYIYI